MNHSQRLDVAALLAGPALLICCTVHAADPSTPSGAGYAPCSAPPAPATLAPGTALKDCDDTPELVAIHAGTFDMGDVLGNGYDYERPVHRVRVEAFLIGRYEVTVGEWNTCVAAAACPPAGASQDPDPRHPISLVSWDEAELYLAWLGRRTGRQYRLPSEAEWEYAARAGSETQYTWGNTETTICQHANILDLSGHRAHPSWAWYAGCDDGYAEAAPVGSFPPNAWGLYDMIGNVWEWVADCWHGNYEGAPEDARPWMEDACSKHVNRGGGWGNHARTARVSTRDGDMHTARSDGLGFRVARSVVYARPQAPTAAPPSPSPSAPPAAKPAAPRA
jgi:formylglycine-generating enzyme required for sulfatase activity